MLGVTHIITLETIFNITFLFIYYVRIVGGRGGVKHFSSYYYYLGIWGSINAHTFLHNKLTPPNTNTHYRYIIK